MRLDQVLPAAAGVDVEISGSRLRQPAAVRRGRCSSACPASPATATSSPPTRSPAARWRWSSSARSSSRARRSWSDVRAAMAPAAAAFYGDPTARAGRRRGHRHQRQDDDRVPRPRAARGRTGARPGCWGRSRAWSAGSSTTVERTTPEAIDLQRTFREMLDARRSGLRDRGLLARARAAPRRRDPLRRRDLHQPDPGPPRLPSDDGGLLRRQAACCSAERRAGPRAAIVNVDDPYGARLAAELARADHVRAATRDADYRGADVRDGPGRLDASPCTRPTAPLALRLAAAGRVQRLQRARGARGGARARAFPRKRASAAIATAGQVPGPLRDRRRGPAVRGAGRLRPHARLAGERAARGPRR